MECFLYTSTIRCPYGETQNESFGALYNIPLTVRRWSMFGARFWGWIRGSFFGMDPVLDYTLHESSLIPTGNNAGNDYSGSNAGNRSRFYLGHLFRREQI
jgi:hypothetical protein